MNIFEAPDPAARSHRHKAILGKTGYTLFKCATIRAGVSGYIQNNDLVDGPGINKVQSIPVVRFKFLSAEENRH